MCLGFAGFCADFVGFWALWVGVLGFQDFGDFRVPRVWPFSFNFCGGLI